MPSMIDRFAYGVGSLALILLLAFAFVPGSFGVMVQWPGVIVWQLAFVLGGIALILRVSQGSRPTLGSGLDPLMGLTLIPLLVSVATAPFPGVSLWYLAMTAGYGILLYALYVSQLRLWPLAYALAGTSLVAALLSLGLWWPQRADFWDDYGPKNLLMLGQHNFVGGYLVLVLPLLVALTVAEKGWKRILWGTGSLLLLINLYTTSSRGAIIGLLVAGLLGWLGFVIWSQGKTRRWGLLAGLVLLVLASGLLLSHPRVQSLFIVRPQAAQVVDVDDNGHFRLILWQTSLSIAQAHPFTGVGLGNLSRVYNFYETAPGQGTPISGVQQVHNTPMQLLAELGYPGLLIYLGWIGVIGHLWWQVKSRVKGWAEQCLASGIVLGFVAYAVSSLTDYQLENIPIALNCVVLLVLLLRLRDQNVIKEISPPWKLFTYRMIQGGIAVALAMMILIQAPVDYAMHLGSLAKANQQAGQIQQSYNHLVQASRIIPDDPIYPFTAALRLQQVIPGIPDPAIQQQLTQQLFRHLDQAIAASPASDLFNAYAGIWWLDHDAATAQRYLERTTQLSTFAGQGFYTYYYLALAYLKQNNTAAATTALTLQSLTDPAFLTFPLWNDSQLQPLLSQVLNRTLQLLSPLSGRSTATESIALLQWWFGLPVTAAIQTLRPIVQSLVLASDYPQKALEILHTLPNRDQALSIQVWIDPLTYGGAFRSYLQERSGLKPPAQEEFLKMLTMPDSSKPTLPQWLSQVTTPTTTRITGLGIMAYRNTSGAENVLVPAILDKNWLPERLELWTPVSYRATALAEVISRVRTTDLKLPHWDGIANP